MSRHFHKPQRASLILLLTSVLAGCLSEVNVRPTLTEDTVVKPEQGVLVARFVNAGNYPLPFNQMTIAPQNLNQSDVIKPERFVSVTKQVDGNTVFAATVDAGSYALDSIRSFQLFGQYTYSRFINADATFGTFQIRPGQTTDLGTIVYYPKPAGDKFEDILVRVPDTATGATIDAYAPFHQYDPDTLLTWDADGFEDDRQGLYASIVQNPVNFETAYETPDGSILFLAPLGVILERDVSGNWSADAVDTNLQMFAAAQNDAGDRAVAGADGKVFLRPVGGAWQDVSLDVGQHVDSLSFAPDGKLVALVRERSALVIKVLPLSGQWSDVNQFVATRGWYKENSSPRYASRRATKPRRMDAATFREFEGRRYVEVGMRPLDYGNSAAAMKELTFEFDPVTYVMKGIENPKEVLYEADAGALKLAVKEAGFFSWAGKPTFLRSDAQEGWVEIARQLRMCGDQQTTEYKCSDSVRSKRLDIQFLSPPWFKNESHAVALARIDRPQDRFAETPTEPRLLVTDDGGKTWTLTDHKVPEPYCASLIAQVDDRLLLSCRGVNGDFFESFDDGASWTQVREHENF